MDGWRNNSKQGYMQLFLNKDMKFTHRRVYRVRLVNGMQAGKEGRRTRKKPLQSGTTLREYGLYRVQMPEERGVGCCYSGERVQAYKRGVFNKIMLGIMLVQCALRRCANDVQAGCVQL